MNTNQLMMRAVTIAAAGAIALVDVMPAVAAPVLSSTAIVKSTAPDMIDQVRVWRGRRGYIGPGIGFGILGAVAGIAAASSYAYGPGYYGGGPYYGGPYYGGAYYGSPYYGQRYYGGYAYDPGPVVVAPAYAPRVIQRGGCWITTDAERGYGYPGPCYR